MFWKLLRKTTVQASFQKHLLCYALGLWPPKLKEVFWVFQCNFPGGSWTDKAPFFFLYTLCNQMFSYSVLLPDAITSLHKLFLKNGNMGLFCLCWHLGMLCLITESVSHVVEYILLLNQEETSDRAGERIHRDSLTSVFLWGDLSSLLQINTVNSTSSWMLRSSTNICDLSCIHKLTLWTYNS